MKNFISIIYCFFLPAAALAQNEVAADSIYVYRQAANSIAFMRKDATQLRAGKVDSYSRAGISYNYETGSFRRPQAAQTAKSTSFSTDGVVTLSRFKLYGYFSFERSKDDSLAFNMKGIKDSDQPTYYFAAKAGNYERQNYTGGGIISYELKKDKIFLATGLDYYYNSAAGSVDPRLLSYIHKMVFNPEMTYKLHNHYFGLGISAGYGNEEMTIGYKSNDFKTPDRVTYLSYGYSKSSPYPDNLSRNSSFTGLNFNYSAEIADWNLSAKLCYQVAEERLRPKFITNLNPPLLQIFQMESKQLSFLASEKTTGHDQQISLSVSKDVADDKMIENNSRNYTFKREDAKVSYSYLNKKNQRSNIEWIAGLNYQHVYKKDAVSNLDFDYSYFAPEIGINQYWHKSNKDLISAGVAFAGMLPLKTVLNVRGIQQDLFTSGVVYPEDEYWSSKAGKAALSFNYITSNIIKGFRTGMSLKTSYLKKLSDNDYEITSSFHPEKGYLSLNLGINLYL